MCHDRSLADEPEPGDPAGEMRRLFGDRWEIQRVTVEVWVATHKSDDGRHVRVLAGAPDELLRKLRAADE